jgi:hypothetical protein
MTKKRLAIGAKIGKLALGFVLVYSRSRFIEKPDAPNWMSFFHFFNKLSYDILYKNEK